jgi:hypothetical protein
MQSEMTRDSPPDPPRRSSSLAFAGGAAVGALGGLIGLGGAEFRLPLLIGLFRFPALEAVILNKAPSGRSCSTCWPAASLGPGPVPAGPAGRSPRRCSA